jgi:hypothetical protein
MQNGTGKTVQAEQDRKKKDKQNRTGRTGQVEQGR